MINTLKKLFGMGPKVDYSELMKQGAQIIDVRSPAEFQGGHIKGSVNIPLQSLQGSIGKRHHGCSFLLRGYPDFEYHQ
jgi:hypothetical protein